MPDAEFLCQIGAAKRDASEAIRPTKAGLLMLGQEWRIVYEYPSYFLDHRRETGGNRRWDDRFTSQELEWTGNVFDFYGRVYMKLKQALDVPFKLDADMRRVDETPAHEALREAIVNAITNADFSSSRAVVIRWTEAGIELKNPGTFRVGVEGAYAGGTSDARNKNLLKIFSLIQIGERAGSGVPNMVDQWMSCGYGKPELSESYDPEVSTVMLPLSADSADGISGKSAESVGRKATGQTVENGNAIVAYLAEHGEEKSAEIAAIIGLGTSRTNDLLRGLAGHLPRTEDTTDGRLGCSGVLGYMCMRSARLDTRRVMQGLSPRILVRAAVVGGAGCRRMAATRELTGL